jgi:glycosyltransferase involved in cell wall biosynthesis
VLCVASLDERKGHRFLIEACRLLRGRNVELFCELVGDGPLWRKIDALIRKSGLQDCVVMRGARTRSEVARMLAEADVAALASIPTRSGRCEGIPVVLMEAMASGLPVVATRVTGIPELVDSRTTGFLVAPGNAHEIADALYQLWSDVELRRRMGQAGREKVLHEFNLRTNAAVLRQLISGFQNPVSADA